VVVVCLIFERRLALAGHRMFVNLPINSLALNIVKHGDSGETICQFGHFWWRYGHADQAVGLSFSKRFHSSVLWLLKKVKFSHTRYPELGPELIPVSPQVK